MAKKSAAAPSLLNPRSGKVVLFALRKHGELPRRDLTAGDLNALAYRRALRADPRKRPADLATAETLEALADELVAGGFYSRDLGVAGEVGAVAIIPNEPPALPGPLPTNEPPVIPAETPEA